ncbi:ATP-binding cassette sub-family A member 13 isoform X2 [Ailuropoda melanoleuca]|uniref:ATP binding cassette subfamily A member 13 n=1 Tax=Ailuropoda melanoleuca TaxID=9646 RepID=A0A7N5JVP2_AILME|nr:ATP-binding cassette sub-family A member 13 isoform X2 [Ailuropoda melanoleuca]
MEQPLPRRMQQAGDKVLSLAEFFWPCILFMILTVLRFQEPPRHRDNCFLQARDLPSRGVFPFVQALLCNTGSACRNMSYAELLERHLRSSRFRAAAGRHEVKDLAFLEEIQDLAEELWEILDKAKILQELWARRAKAPDSSPSSSFLAMDLNKTEEVISKLEKLHQQPHIWNFLLLLPRLYANDVRVEDRIRGGTQLLQAALNSLATLEELDWLPLNHTFSTVSEIVLNVTISMLTFLQEHGVGAAESRYNLSLQELVWDPQKVQADLRSRFGFDELRAERILNYSAELQEIPTERALERMVCCVLSQTSKDEADQEGHPGDCHPRWSAAADYLVHAVSWLQVYKQVFHQRQKGRELQQVLEGAARSLEELGHPFAEDQEPRQVVEALPAVLRILSDSVAPDGPTGSHPSPKTLLHLQKLENVLRDLPPWPALKRLLLLLAALRNAIAQNLHFIQEVIMCLEKSAHSSELGGPDAPQPEEDAFFQWKQLLAKNATDRCRNASLSGREAFLCHGNPGIWEGLWGLTCPHDSSNKTGILNKLQRSAEDADRLLQEVITGHTDGPVSGLEGFLGWQEVEAQLADVGLSCRRLSEWLRAATSPGDLDLAGDCTDPLIAALVFHTLGEVQLSLEETSYWKDFTGFIRKTCELVHYANVQGSVQNGQSASSKESPCYEENMDWEVITDNYFTFLSNLLKSPAASISRVLNSTKELLMMEKKMQSLEDEEIDFFLSFVEFLEKLLPDPFDSPSVPKFHDLPSLTETLLNTSHLWANHLRSLGSDPSATDIQKLLEFGKAVINKIETLERLWIKNESNNILRFMELVLSEIDPKLLELWMYGISKRERVNLETLSTLLNFSVPEDERDLSKNLNFSQLFHSDWPWSLAMETDFVHLSETVISSLYEFGFLKEGQVSAALDTVYAIRNASELFSALSEPERREVDRILTQIYLNVFQDNDSALLLKIYSSCFQYIYKFLSIPSTESLLSFLAQTSEHILDIIKQFNFQNIGKAFAFLYETIGALEGLSEGSYCQQLLSTFKYLELQAQSLMSTEGPELEVVHATLTGLKQLLMVDEDFRISVFQYMSQLFNGSVGALSDNECFALDNKSISSVNYSIHRGSPFILPWAQILSNLSANSSAFNELMAVHCTIVWLHMWTEIWGSVSQIFQFDMNIFTPLHVGLTQLLGELESDVKISKSCQGMFPTHRPARLLLNLFKNVTQADGFHDWDDFLALRDLWVVLGDALVRVKSLSPDQVGKSIFTMETALRQLKTFLFNTNASREFFYSLLDVFTELSDTSAYIDRNVGLINHFLSNNVTDYGVKFESVITKLRETMLLLQNVSHDQDVLSCADIFENVTEFILEDDSLHVNISQRTLRILAVLNSTFSSEDTISRLKGCVAWVDIMNRLYMIYNSSVIHGYPQGNWRSFRAVEDKINSTLKLVTWILNIKGPHCTLNKSDINCVHIVLKNVTDFLNALLTEVFEKERVPKFEILLTLLNDSTNQVRMIINNLTRDFDLASQSNWTRFTELILRPVALSGDVPRHFTEFWQHLVALGKEIQKLMKGTPIHILENNSSSTPDKCLNLCATSPKGTDVNRLGGSLYHLASYLVSNFSQDLQNPPQIIPHRITNAVGLGIQLMRDVFNSLAPSVLHSIPQDPGETQVFRKVASLLRTLKKTDIDLLVDQLEQMSESLTEFFKNISSLGTGSLGTNLLVGLMEKFVDSSHSWNVNHLLKFSHLFPKDDVNVVVDMYYVIPHAVRLLQRGVDKNITEVLKDVYNFTVLHGISISNVTKEDFAVVIKTLLDAVELISEKPEILSEAFTCLPVVWCWNHTTSGFRQNPKLEACKSHELMSSSFYSEVASLLDHLHLSPPGEGLQCMDEGSQKEITRKMVCVIRDLVDWTSLLLELSEVFHVKISLVKTVQEFWHKVLPFVPSSENQSNGSISELCPSGPIKQIASQIIAKLKNVNFTKIPLDENILDTLASLNKILNISEGTEASIQNKISLNFEKIMKFPSGDRHPENSTRSLDPPFVTFLDPNLTGSSLEAPSSFTEKRAVTYNSSYFEELGLELEQIMTDPSHDFPIRPLLSEIIKGIHTINSETLQNVTLQLAHFFKSLGSSSWKTAEIIEDFLLVVKNWLRKQAKEDDSRMIQTLFLLTANESLTDLALLTKDIATFLGLLKTTSREGNFDITHLTQLLSQEQLTNFSFVRFLFESFLVNLISKLAGSSPEAASNASNTDLHIMNLLTVNQTQSENGESIILPPRSIVDFTQQVLETFFSFLLEENSENRISLLLKAFHKDITAELSFVPKDKILEILTLDQFLTTSKEDRLMSIFSSVKETLNHLIKSSFILDNGTFYFDHHRGLKFMRDLFNALLRETPGKNKTENNSEFLAVVSQLLSHTNSSEDLLQLSHNLRSALLLVRESSTELARLIDVLVNSPHKGFRDLYPIFREVILSNLTDLLSYINNSFPLRNRATLDITKRLLGVISKAGGESGAPGLLLEMSDTLTMLVRDIAEMRDLCTSVTSAVELVGLAMKVARKMATIFETHPVSNTNDTMKFFDSLYSVLRQSVRNVVSEISTLKNVDHFIPENISDLLTSFLDLVFRMIGVKPSISQDSDVVNMSSSTFSYVNQSKDFSDILKEIAEFLTSVKGSLGTMEQLVVAFNNGTQVFAMDSVNVWEEILDCLVPINNIINQIDFLHPNLLPTHSYPQDIIWKRTQGVIPFWDEMLSQDRMETGTSLRRLIDLTLEALWNDLEKDDWNVFNLLLTLAQHPDNLLKATETAGEVSGGRGDLSGALFSNTSLIQNVTHQQLGEAVQIMLRRIALLRKELPLNNSQWGNSTRTLFHPIFESFINAATGKTVTLGKEERTKKVMADFPYILEPLSSFEQFLKGFTALTEHWQEVPLMDQSVEMCQIFQQFHKPPEAIVTLQKVVVLVLRVFVILAENPSLMKDMLCSALSCKQGGMRRLLLPALQGAAVMHDHYQEIQKMWSSPLQLNCEGLSRNLSGSLESFKSSLEHATERDCECQPLSDLARQRVHTLAQSLQKTWLSGSPVLTFLSNFTGTQDVKVKDLMQNVSKLTHELRSSINISDETIHSILEASISRSQLLSNALTVALSRRCDADVLRLLLALPEDRKSRLAAKELCGLPGPQVYSLIVSMTQNMNLRNVIYKALMPLEAHGALSSLLDVVSRLSHLLAKAGHVLEYLPEFLHAYKITALLDMPDFQQAPHHGQTRSSAFGSFQFVMKKFCKEQASFFSGSNLFINLPRINELLGEDKEKFNIPEDSTPFCLNLYQEILQSPDGALVWSFLKPILHGKILYTPNTAEIHEVIQKANYTFHFMDKLKTLTETLLKMSSVFQSGGSGQMLSQLQEALRNKFIRNFIESQLHIDVDKLTKKLHTYGGKLDKMFAHGGAGRIHFLGRVLVNLSSCVVLDRFQALESVASLEAKARELMRQNSFLASIIFNTSLAGRNLGARSLQLPPHVTYTIRTSVLYSMRTDLVKNPFWKFHPQSLPADGFKYNYIFVPLQDMIERAIISVQTGKEAVEPAAQTQAIPYPCHTRDLFLNNVGFFFPLIMMLMWMVSVASMVRKLVYEREIQIEEYMRTMGVHPTVFFLAWFLENMAMLALSSAALAVILKASGIFAHSNACLIFLFLLDFAVSVVMLSYFLSAFFSRANTAALCTSLVYMISFLPYIVLLVLHNQLSVVVQTFLCLLSTTAFGQGVFFVTFLEGQEAGVQWSNVYQPPEQTGMTFGWVCWMILFDSGLYFLCGWYLNNLIPGTFGLRKPWYFPFTASYWKNLCGLVAKRPHAPGSDLSFINEHFDSKGSSLQNGEGKPGGGPPGVALISVTKEYEPHKAAVRDLTLTFHRDQITALLGTNGAGKTTVISMLTGLYAPTSGTIFINGKNLQTDLSSIRRELGVCLQQDVLFDNLTVREHLLLFASVKAPQWAWKELHQQVSRTLREVELTQHQHKQTRVLSGGMKRKLSIGIAFIGTSRTVVLDEPTSGVDPCSRRGIWDILLKYREGRTVIFTTHHLDEAEALSDRVAFLQQGRLRCCAPPFCLTEAYGQGLSLTLTKQTPVLEADDPKDIARATSLIQTYIPQAFLKASSGRELVYSIPKDADRACFKGLFQALEQNLHSLHVMGFGISDTTLEEVFLMLLQDSKKQSGAELEPQDQRPPEHVPGRCGALAGTPHAWGSPRPLAQAVALLGKRLRHTRRAWKGALSDLLLPVLFVALAMALFMVRPLAIDFLPLKLTPGHYDRAEAYFFSSGSGSEGQELAHVLLRKFGDQDPLCADLNPDPKNSSCWRVDPLSQLPAQDSCSCLRCPNVSAGAPYLTNRLGHTLLNLSAFHLEEYLLLPSERPRLGGWSFGVQIPDQVQDANPNTSQPDTLAKVWYNQKGFHSLPSYLNHLNNLILWRHLPPDQDWRQYGITLYSHPYGGALMNEDKILESIRQCGVALCIVLGFSILSASLGSSVVRDRVTGAKRLQHISGLGYRTYWLTNFLYDMVFYLVSVSLCVTIIVAFQLTAFTFRENLAATALLLALFGYATLPWMYLMSRIFSSSDVAFISYVSLNFIFGLCTMLMTTMPRLLAIVSKAQNLQNTYDVLKWVFTIFPQFCLGQGLIELCYNQIKYDLTHNFGIDSYVSPFEMNFLGWIFVQLASQGTVLLLLRILLHWDLLQRPRGQSAIQGTVTSSKDIDVEKEQIRVLKGRTSEDLLVLYNLSKTYGSFFKRTIAVRDISLGIRRGECFGLLGPNGAGKSTTFKMLNGDAPPTSGRAVVRTPTGEVVDLSLAGMAGVRIGYCPQQDALDELLTGWEHLHYYCCLRGIPKTSIPQVVGDLVRRLHLEAHVDKLVATYSGGTKRKLSTALALLGKPDLLLLDEPSSGMDPCSKRFLWNTIMQEARRGCAVVLTSHSMEECEALCTRLAIMVNGSFRCLGSPQHIKDRFGDGYSVKIWLCQETNLHGAVSDCLKLHFPGIQFKGQHLNLLEYHVPKQWECLADLFRVLENDKSSLNIKHYSITQTTLEQVFINFTTEPQKSSQSTVAAPRGSYQPPHLPI